MALLGAPSAAASLISSKLVWQQLKDGVSSLRPSSRRHLTCKCSLQEEEANNSDRRRFLLALIAGSASLGISKNSFAGPDLSPESWSMTEKAEKLMKDAERLIKNESPKRFPPGQFDTLDDDDDDDDDDEDDDDDDDDNDLSEPKKALKKTKDQVVGSFDKSQDKAKGFLDQAQTKAKDLQKDAKKWIEKKTEGVQDQSKKVQEQAQSKMNKPDDGFGGFFGLKKNS